MRQETQYRLLVRAWALRFFPSFRWRPYADLLESRILCSLTVANREFRVVVYRDHVPLRGLIIVGVYDILRIPTNSMQATGDAGIVPANKEVQLTGVLSLSQEIVAPD